MAVYRGVIKQADLKKQLDTLIATGSERGEREQIAMAKGNKPDTSSVPS